MTTATRANDLYKRVGYALVRDAKTGRPKIDRTADLHPMHLMMMTADERAATGQHADCWVRDAQGFKRVTKAGQGTYRADDDLVAVSQVFDVHTGTVWQLAKRGDVRRHGEIVIEGDEQ